MQTRRSRQRLSRRKSRCRAHRGSVPTCRTTSGAEGFFSLLLSKRLWAFLLAGFKQMTLKELPLEILTVRFLIVLTNAGISSIGEVGGAFPLSYDEGHKWPIMKFRALMLSNFFSRFFSLVASSTRVFGRGGTSSSFRLHPSQ